MKFIQLIEYKTSRYDEIEKLLDGFLAATEGKRLTTSAQGTRDRDRPDTYVSVVEFPSYEVAQRNSQLPETQQFAEQMAKLVDGPPIFRNLDVIRESE